MQGLKQLLKRLEIDDLRSRIIIDLVSPDELKNYIKFNFKPSENLVKSKWIPNKVFYDFIAKQRPNAISTANLIGRALTEINVAKRNNHVNKIGSMPGYYVEAINNIMNYELIKFKENYDYGKTK